MKSVLTKYFNSGINQCSPVIIEYYRKVDIDENQREYISYVPLDTRSIIKQNGSFIDWKLTNLIQAGINPQSLNIHTGTVSRLDGVDTVNRMVAELDAVLESQKEKE